jgi:uncharacterized repeat protein (TIGR01451 family)
LTTSIKTKSSGYFRGILAVMTVLWMTALPFSAQAALQGSAGNTIVRNTITVNYSDAKGNALAAVSFTVNITVNTVAATPTILSVTPSPGSTDGSGNTQTYTFRIRTNSNGPGAISFGTADGTFTNVAAGTAPTVPANIFLGSTVIDPTDPMTPVVALANGGNVTYKVPNDGGVPSDTAVTGGAIGDGVINGLKATDNVYLYTGTAYYGPFTVFSVTDPAVGAGLTAAPATIVLTNASGGPLTFTPAYGWQIVEAKDVTVTVTQGIVPTATAQNPASWVTTLTATMGAAAPANTPTVTTNAHMGRIDIVKYVRNVSTPITGTGAFTPPVTINGAANTFYTAGVTGKPGQILEYLVVLTNGGTGNATAVIATDVMPTYATLVSATTYGGGTAGLIFAHARYGATETDLNTDNSGGTANVAYGKSTGTTAGSTMNFNAGTGCTNVFPTGGGAIATTLAAYVIYQVKIN